VNVTVTGLGAAGFLGLLGVMLLVELQTAGRLGPAHRVTREAADVAKTVCFCALIPVGEIVFLPSPQAWQPQDFRNSDGFRQETVIAAFLLEILVVLGAVRAVRRRRNRPG